MVERCEATNDNKPNAILVCVDYADLLAITLPANRHHFNRVVVVSSSADGKAQLIATRNGAENFITESFYDDGAAFNKWKALEQGLDFMGRRGWICILDADVLWPENSDVDTSKLEWETLYGCHRRMLHQWPHVAIPVESEWAQLPNHPNVNEWAGFTQLFHAQDSHLGTPPWHETDWLHAGGADSFFQDNWPRDDKMRLPFEVLHLGPDGHNWCGRASAYADGGKHPLADQRREQLLGFWQTRKNTRSFDSEKIGGET